MAIFNKKTKNETGGAAVKKADKEKAVPQAVKTVRKGNAAGAAMEGKSAFSHVLLRPRITEKATDHAMKNAYVFEVDARSNKDEIRQAIEQFYGVKPLKIHTMPIHAKKIFSRGKMGTTSGGKKAIVYLKKGDSIEFV